ncbi:hypothetical protein [Vallitalea okinawensis]|uniref:hypothetical protein n=1 Tax=Vallitalea okinawensis TaxID=2078660 RepID=UPI000CFC6C97|nr:hypothetical protein [Vallitalea okinawensis]
MTKNKKRILIASVPPMCKGGIHPPLGMSMQGSNFDTESNSNRRINLIENYAVFAQNLGISIDISRIIEDLKQGDDILKEESEKIGYHSEFNCMQEPVIENDALNYGVGAYIINTQFYKTDKLVDLSRYFNKLVINHRNK